MSEISSASGISIYVQDKAKPKISERLKNSPVYPMNQVAIETLLTEKSEAEKTEAIPRDNWLAVVPGESEWKDVSCKCAATPGCTSANKGYRMKSPYVFSAEDKAAEKKGYHHSAPPACLDDSDGDQISNAFKERLERAYLIAKSGFTPFVMISGGDVDPAHNYAHPPEYNEAERGRAYLLKKYGAVSPTLASHILIEPFSHTTPENMHNTEKFANNLGLNSTFIVTHGTEGANGNFLDTVASQANYLAGDGSSFFEARAEKETWRARSSLGSYSYLKFTNNGYTDSVLYHPGIQVRGKEINKVPFLSGGSIAYSAPKTPDTDKVASKSELPSATQ